MNFRKRLLDFRAKHNLTQKQLAELFGVHINMIYRYEHNIRNPSAVNKIKFENKMKDYEVKKNENVSL